MTETATRNADLKKMLCEHRRQMEGDVLNRIRVGRESRSHEVYDALECTDAHSHADIDLALLQMRAETLLRIDEALVRLDADKYGSCFECAEEISEKRLLALPFAVRCQQCQEEREQAHAARKRAQKNSEPSRFAAVA